MTFPDFSAFSRRFVRLAALLPALVLAQACGGDDDDNPPSGPDGPGSGDMTAVTRRLEAPAARQGRQVVAHWTLEGGQPVMTYCLEYDAGARHSRWVAFRFDALTRQRNCGRQYFNPQYPRDPQLPAAVAAEDCALYGSGYDHGHLCASADRLYSAAANVNTFYMSNMSPQRSNFNQGYWVTLEGRVQQLGRNNLFADTLYVVKGGTVAEGQTLGRTRGAQIAIPAYYYMALLRVRGGRYSGIAFLMEHADHRDASGRPYTNQHQAPLAAMHAHAVSIDSLERFTGIDFFPNLPDAAEEQVERQCDAAVWLGAE